MVALPQRKPHRFKAAFSAIPRKERPRLWQLAQMVGCSESTMSRYLDGIIPMPELIEKQLESLIRGFIKACAA